MTITELIECISKVTADHVDNRINEPSQSSGLIEFLSSTHKKIPAELREYLAAVDGGCLTFPLFFDYEHNDFIGSVGTGELLSHKDIKEIITRTFSDDSIYYRTKDMADNHAKQKTIPLISLGDGQTIDYRPSNGKAYCYGRVVAQSLGDLLIKQCLMPDFFRPEDSRCHEGTYPMEWVNESTAPDAALKAFLEGLSSLEAKSPTGLGK